MIKISELIELTSAEHNTDVIPIVDASEGITKKIKCENLFRNYSTLHNDSNLKVNYIKLGNLIFVEFSGVISENIKLTLPVPTVSSVISLRDNTTGELASFWLDSSCTIRTAGALNYIENHSYSGYFTFITRN